MHSFAYILLNSSQKHILVNRQLLIVPYKNELSKLKIFKMMAPTFTINKTLNYNISLISELILIKFIPKCSFSKVDTFSVPFLIRCSYV